MAVPGTGVLLPDTIVTPLSSVSSAVQYAHSLLVIVCHYVTFLTKSWCWMIYNILELCFDNFSGCYDNCGCNHVSGCRWEWVWLTGLPAGGAGLGVVVMLPAADLNTNTVNSQLSISTRRMFLSRSFTVPGVSLLSVRPVSSLHVKIIHRNISRVALCLLSLKNIFRLSNLWPLQAEKIFCVSHKNIVMYQKY